MQFEDVSIVVIGYDPYIDVWNHYFELLNKYWKDRPKTYLITNEILPSYSGVETIAAGKDAEWSRKVQCALERIDSRYFILLLEDFFTTRKVDANVVSELIKIIRENDVKYCKVLNQSKIKGTPFQGRSFLRVIGEETEYGVSLQPAIWNRDFLSRLVGTENYNAWIFEFNQVKNKSQILDGAICLADNRNPLEITHAVVQSKYLPSAVRAFKKQGYTIDTSARAVLSNKEYFKYRAKQIFKWHSPKSLKPFLKKIGRLMKIDFVSDRQLGGN